MPTTSPDNIFYENGATGYSDATNAALQASSIQTALSLRQQYTFVWPTSSGRTGQTGMRNGDTGYQQDTQTLYTYNGSTWNVSGISPWVPWSPTTTGITVGSTGSIIAVYRYVGSKVECKFIVLFSGTGVAVSANPTFTLPVSSEPILSPYTVYSGGGSCYIPSNIFPLFTLASGTSSTTVLFYALGSTGSGFANINSTTPGTWAAGSSISLQFSYLPA